MSPRLFSARGTQTIQVAKNTATKNTTRDGIPDRGWAGFIPVLAAVVICWFMATPQGRCCGTGSSAGDGDVPGRGVGGDRPGGSRVVLDIDPHLSGRRAGVDLVGHVGDGEMDASGAGFGGGLLGRPGQGGVDAA